MYINSNDILVKECFDFLGKKKVIIFGAGKIGTSLIHLLQHNEIKIYQVWDNKHYQYNDIEGLNVVKPDLNILNKEEIVLIITIYAQNVTKKLHNDFQNLGFKNILSNRTTINKLFYSQCKELVEKGIFTFSLNQCHICPVSKDIDKRCDIYDNYIEQEFISEKKEHSNGIIIPSMGILVSNKCNLTCQGCNQLRDYYTSKDSIDIEPNDIINDILKLSNAVDKIEKVVIVGGESLLYANIEKLISKIMDISNIGIIQFITNGTVIPKSDEIFKLLSNSRVKVEVSGYGNYLSKKHNTNVKIFLSKLEEFKVNVEYVKTLQWFDFGDFKKRNYSQSEWHDVYNKCCFISNDLFNGELHKCARSVFGKHLNKIPSNANDYIDIRNTKEEELPEKIREFLNNKLPDVCQYCNGTSSLTIVAGKQKEI